MVIILCFSFFPPSVYCLMFFVSKFQGSMSTSLSVALIWSTSCIHGFDWKSWLFINTFLFQISLISKWSELQMPDRSQVKDNLMWFFAITLISLSVCLSVHLSICCMSFHPSVSSHPAVHWFKIPQWWLVIGKRILNHYPCPIPKIAFASLLLITKFRLGVIFQSLVL